MGQKVDNDLKGCSVEKYVGGNENNYYYGATDREAERAFVVTHNVNTRPVSYFTGRETELQELRQRIEEGRKSVLVSGMRGIGKTHICRKLFEEYQNNKGDNRLFSHIGYIEYNGDMNSSLQECLVYQRQSDPELDKQAAWRELECLASNGKLLLFVDNVNVSVGADPGLKRLKYLPGAIVLTSRRTSFSREFEPIRIGFLDTEQCRKIYEKIRFEEDGIRLKEEEIPILDDIIEKLAARHTITVEHLAHLALTRGWSIKTLQHHLQNSGFQLEYINEEEELVNIQKSYEVLYDLSQLTDAEQNILEAFSVFPYILLKREICEQWLLADAKVREDNHVLFGLYRKGWLQFDIEQESYALHPVFAQFIYQKCKPSLEEHQGLIEECQKCLEIPESGSILECQKFVPFAESILEKVDMGECGEQILFLISLGDLLQQTAEYEKAKKLYEKALEICRELLGEEHLGAAVVYNNLALLYEKKGEYEKAEEVCKKSLSIREKLLGEDHPDTARSYHNLAVLYEEKGEYDKAEELYKKSLSILEKLLGEEHPNTANSYHNLAGVYKEKGEYEKAEELYKKSLRIREKVLGEDHPDTASSYHNLAVLYEEKGEYDKAEELYKRSLSILEKVLGEDHPDTASSYHNLAVLYEEKGEYDKAEELCKKSLRIREKLLGEDHPDTVSSYHNLALLYKKKGGYDKAEELYKKSLRIREKLLGEEHPDTASSYNNLAVLYEKKGEYDKAEELYKRSLSILEKVLGEEHPNTASSYHNLAGVCKEKGEYDKAEELCKKSLRIREKLLGEEHPDTASSYNNLAGVYFGQEEYQISLAYFLKAYQILVFKFGADHPNTKVIYENMETVYKELDPEGNFNQWLEENYE